MKVASTIAPTLEAGPLRLDQDESVTTRLMALESGSRVPA